ncbi:MAG TPA: cytochrome c maturation protein CcmE [Gaiellaceae bacterium]|nr:cytochrome c maturation protein CcmE [Gaiellaceae bacterium]
MARKASPVRLVFALSVAAALAVFLLYVSVAGGTPSVQPSQLKDHKGKVALVGKVVGPQTGDPHGAGMRFRLRDVEGGAAAVPVLYRGSVPDQFKIGREIRLEGRVRNGVFVGQPGTLVTKCPSKYTADKRA